VLNKDPWHTSTVGDDKSILEYYSPRLAVYGFLAVVLALNRSWTVEIFVASIAFLNLAYSVQRQNDRSSLHVIVMPIITGMVAMLGLLAMALRVYMRKAFQKGLLSRIPNS
jgi:hypothetical protein